MAEDRWIADFKGWLEEMGGVKKQVRTPVRELLDTSTFPPAVLVSDGKVVDGNHRTLWMRKLWKKA